MGYREDMEHCREYIDERAGEEISARELSEMFGYSFYHFCHVFRAVNGAAFGEYLRDRRLSKAAAELLFGKSVTETALDCGFGTPSGFTKAFVRRFGISPSEYKKRKGGTVKMEPEFKKQEAFTAVGYVFGAESDIDILENGAYWFGKDFSSVSAEDYKKLTYPGYSEIGAWIHPADFAGDLQYFFGPMTRDKSFIPEGMEAIDIPAAEYAVFKVPGWKNNEELHENIKKTWKFIFNDWFDESGYKFNHHAMDFEKYEKDATYIYVPVLKK